MEGTIVNNKEFNDSCLEDLWPSLIYLGDGEYYDQSTGLTEYH